MKRLFFFILSLNICSIGLSYGQDSLAFKPSGRVIARGFLDYSSGFGEANKERGFDITRAFLGYNYQFTKTFSGQVIIDGAAGKTSSDGMEVYLRNAFINWKDNGFNIVNSK